MAPPHASDHALAARAAAGDTQALETLVDRHYGALVRFARGRLTGGLEHLAEDAVQEAAIKALRALGKGVVPPEPRPWLFVIVRNCCSDLRRATHGDAELPEEAVAPAGDVHEAVASADRLGHVVRAIDDLPAGQRRMIIGREFEGRTYEQLATAHATTVGAVKSALVRARRNLAAAPGVYGIAAPFAWMSRRLAPVLNGREAGAELAAGAGAQGAALAAMAATVVTIVPFVPVERPPGAEARTPPAAERRAADRTVRSSARPGTAAAPSADHDAAGHTPDSLLAACMAGRPIDEGVPRAIARRALRQLPADIAEYTTCRADLRRAELDAIAG